MASRRGGGKRLNSSARPLVAGASADQAAARAAYVRQLKSLVGAGTYAPTVDRLVIAITGRALHPQTAAA